MNAKICKRLRRQAAASTVGELHEAYKAIKHPNRAGGYNITFVLHPRCTKAHYRLLKQQTRKSK